ncbi:MAG: zinc ribbon domain-containing protein [Candidatus Aminicenantes bacterium]|nr:zinc ribbon domain-containing protein [Candidatus Aminicenantes bacterium]
MPTYEYECETCGWTFEKMQPITAEPLRKCPKCKGRIHRVISGGGGFIMKGGSTHEGEACSLQRTGRTCCGRSEPCGEPSCGNGE